MLEVFNLSLGVLRLLSWYNVKVYKAGITLAVLRLLSWYNVGRFKIVKLV